jgi:hypothetical protein
MTVIIPPIAPNGLRLEKVTTHLVDRTVCVSNNAPRLDGVEAPNVSWSIMGFSDV